MATSIDQSNVNSDNQRKLETLKSLRENVNWEIEGERRGLLNQLYALVENWTDQLPNLREIFRAEEIDWLLSAAVSDNHENEDKRRFVEFVASTGYKDEPKVDKDGKPLLNRTTPIHLAGRIKYSYLILTQLFRIYNRFDVNYVDELGMTHFHVACKCDSYTSAAEKFLKFGQDPNCHPPPLHEAIAGYNNFAILHLLKSGADPNLADAEGLTPLHKICKRFNSDIIPVSMLFIISDEKHQLVKVDPLDKFGRTPLHYALMIEWHKKKIVQLLIKIKNATPNLADVDGLTPLHLICQRNFEEEDLVELFFEMCDEKHHLVPVDPLDNRGRTPLHYAVTSLLPNTVDFLLNRGADLSKFVFPTERFKIWFGYYYDCKLKLASGAMGVVENLERRGYELDQNNVLMIMKWYAKYGLFEKSEELEKYLYNDEEFRSVLNNIFFGNNNSEFRLTSYVKKPIESEQCRRFISPRARGYRVHSRVRTCTHTQGVVKPHKVHIQVLYALYAENRQTRNYMYIPDLACANEISICCCFKDKRGGDRRRRAERRNSSCVYAAILRKNMRCERSSLYCRHWPLALMEIELLFFCLSLSFLYKTIYFDRGRFDRSVSKAARRSRAICEREIYVLVHAHATLVTFCKAFAHCPEFLRSGIQLRLQKN
ncbi:unnamed protein product [Trichogramma brassicae]|uniref:Uncharacterized protein n=1 Tax=Trichogramma brassicae TaxID=86971 RepID=A0A6H5ITQ7_9HYME|nr:unnamed protein product [Trichogramma brassicae]